jgi:chromatin assembly factor 1 subunit A
MAPPRLPLNPLLKTNAPNILAPHIIDLTSTKSPNPSPQTQTQNENFHILIPRQKVGVLAKPIPAELLAEFKKAIEGSDLTKVGLVEVLKKRFPSITKATIQDNLPLVAERVGERGAEKRWRLLS